MQAANIARNDLRDDTTSRGWKRFKHGIISEKIDDLSAKVFISDSNEGGPVSMKDIASFLHFGTTDHGPVTAKALRFKPKGSKDFIFRKHVKGIKATGFWRLMETSIEKINKLINDWIAKR